MKKQIRATALLLAACSVVALATSAQTNGQDFLSPAEADKVREAPTPAERIKLFIAFADDRMRKLQYELSSKETSQNRAVLLNGLLNGYTSCMDEGTQRLQDAREKGADIRPAIKEMQKQAKSFLETLHKIETAGGPGLESFKDSLGDAMDSTKDALDAANKASKEYGAVPVRRKP